MKKNCFCSYSHKWWGQLEGDAGTAAREAAVMLQGAVAGEALREAWVAREARVVAMVLVIAAPMVRLTSTVVPVVSPTLEKTEGAEISMMEVCSC